MAVESKGKDGKPLTGKDQAVATYVLDRRFGLAQGFDTYDDDVGGLEAEHKGAERQRTGDLVTKEKFGDIQLHVEWMVPKEAGGAGQGRGNSGIELMGRYKR